MEKNRLDLSAFDLKLLAMAAMLLGSLSNIVLD